ncbi:carbonic anhydrase [Thelephora terrestris]|uniref:Carbonic anhydrase n=1 Tax=Thelephora terrestris TaxID=56493 RepID=A0A9P6HJA5_9AGAM|nr:carbonic anhydrase [Thelephora terrestris]
MFSKTFSLYAVLATATLSTVVASPTLAARGNSHRSGTRTLADAADEYPQLLPLEEGNSRFRQSIAESDHPDLLWDLTVNGQHPEFLFLGCSDSRVSEGTIFSPPPGVFFTERNIANQYGGEDLNAIAILAYGVTELRVGHIIVMGHYGCGGVQASILNKPDHLDRAGEAVQAWIGPIRTLYYNSTRDEIVKLREYRAANPDAGPPQFNDSGFRALVEENVKNTVWGISQDPIIYDHWQAFLAEQNNGTLKRASESSPPLKPVYIHGFVYDISSGEIYDLNVSQGPPGWNADWSKCKRNLITAIRHGNTNPDDVEDC